MALQVGNARGDAVLSNATKLWLISRRTLTWGMQEGM